MTEIEKLEWHCRMLTDRLNFRCRVLSGYNSTIPNTDHLTYLKSVIFEDFAELATQEDLLLEKNIYSLGTEFKTIQ